MGIIVLSTVNNRMKIRRVILDQKKKSIKKGGGKERKKPRARKSTEITLSVTCTIIN